MKYFTSLKVLSPLAFMKKWALNISLQNNSRNNSRSNSRSMRKLILLLNKKKEKEKNGGSN